MKSIESRSEKRKHGSAFFRAVDVGFLAKEESP
jgi:hypothetical protein